jgi:hypothetical protein
MARKYKNPAEGKFADTARSNGWEVSKEGWPDFFCQHEDGRTMAIEVKPKSKKDGFRYALKASQICRLAWLQSFGIDCFVSIADDLIPFDEDAEWERYTRLRMRNHKTQEKRKARQAATI